MEKKSGLPTKPGACPCCRGDPPFSEAQKLFLKEMQAELIAAQNKQLEEKLSREAASRKQLEELVNDFGKHLENLEFEVDRLKIVGDGTGRQLEGVGALGKLLSDDIGKLAEIKKNFISLELRDGKPILLMDYGSGVTRLELATSNNLANYN